MFDSTERQGSSAGSWNATPSSPRALTAAGASLPIVTSPESGRSRLIAIRRIVDFPQPDGPISAVSEPAETREVDVLEDAQPRTANLEALEYSPDREIAGSTHQISSSRLWSNMSRGALMPT